MTFSGPSSFTYPLTPLRNSYNFLSDILYDKRGCKKSPTKKLKSSRRGRPEVPLHLKRVQIRAAYRIPQWSADWVKAEGDAGKKIKAALVGFYGLKPPG